MIIAALLGASVSTALAADPKPAAGASGPKRIGTFDDWSAATNQEAGDTVCYAFTKAQSSAPPVSGRGDVVLTVTQRPSGRDAVAISAGFTYPTGATVAATADQTNLSFYTAHRSAFARDGKAAVAALQKARELIAKSPGPHGVQVTDRFSLRGFSAAYAAIAKACPAK